LRDPRQQALLIALIGLVAFGCATARIMAHVHRTPALLFGSRTPAKALPAGAKLLTTPSELAMTYLHVPRPGTGGITTAAAADPNSGYVNPTGGRYPGGAASGPGRSHLRQLT